MLDAGTSIHEVLPATRGARLAAFFWIESLVRSNEQQRQLLHAMDALTLRPRVRQPRAGGPTRGCNCWGAPWPIRCWWRRPSASDWQIRTVIWRRGWRPRP